MIKNKYFKKITSAIGCAALVATCVVSSNASAFSKVGMTHINSTYGNLNGELEYGGKGAKLGKVISTEATTGAKVSNIRAYQKIYLTSTGARLDQDNSGWKSNDNHAYAECLLYEARSDGYRNTPITAYGTCDAITEKAYAVYLSVSNY